MFVQCEDEDISKRFDTSDAELPCTQILSLPLTLTYAKVPMAPFIVDASSKRGANVTAAAQPNVGTVNTNSAVLMAIAQIAARMKPHLQLMPFTRPMVPPAKAIPKAIGR